MSDISSDNNTINLSFLPILALERLSNPYITPYNFIPFESAYQDYKLQILSSVPFGLFNALHENAQSLLIEFTYRPEGLPNIARHLARFRRPVILWVSGSDPDRIEPLVRLIRSFKPFVFLIIAEDLETADFLSGLIDENPTAGILCLENSNTKKDERPLLIWKAYLELFVRLERLLPTGRIILNLPPDKFVNKTFSDLLSAAQTGDISESTVEMKAIPLYDDFIYYPNAIIANHLRGKIPAWIKGKLPEEENNARILENAGEIRERSNLSLLLDEIYYLGSLIEEKQELPQSSLDIISSYCNLLPKKFSKPISDVLNGKKSLEDAKAIFTEMHTSYPKNVFYSQLPQFILVCHSYPFTYSETAKITSKMPGSPLAYFTPEDEHLYSRYFDQTIGGGRSFRFGYQREDQRSLNVINHLGDFSTMENNFLSAVGVFYGLRVNCPVFKTLRAGRPIFTLFHQLDQLIGRHNNQNPDGTLTSDHKLVRKIENLMSNLSDQITKLIDPRILNEIYSPNLDSRVFLLSDIPLDFVKTQSDYLGYTTLLTRLPITPGLLPLDYFNMTESLWELDNEAEQTAIVTSFQTGSIERKNLETIIKAYNYDQSVRILDINSRFELINYLNNNDKIKCLIFFGHGGIERDSNESWIQLPRDNFYNSDIEKLKYIPKTVVLVGCNTSSGGYTLSGMDVPFLQRGAQVIATTFPIPLMIGTSFIGMFLSNFLSAGVYTANGGRYYTDLSEILTVVKRRLRKDSVFLNLVLQGKLKSGKIPVVLNKFFDKLNELEEKDKGNEANPFKAIKETLVEERLIDSYDTPFYEIEKIPYCLFFTCLGYTWNNINKNLTT